MLIHALLLTLLWLMLSSLVLWTLGRHLGGPSVLGSLLLILMIGGIGAGAALEMGMPRSEVIACVLSVTVLGLVVLRWFPEWNAAGHAAWLFLAAASLVYLAVSAAYALLAPVGIVGQSLGLLLLAMQGMGVVLLLSYTHELLDVLCRRRWRYTEARPPRVKGKPRHTRKAPSWEQDDRMGSVQQAGSLPLVALHVPCHDEPPEVVEQTLRALDRLDYPRDAYQVLVVDNNTSDPALWRPVAALCDEMGFTFLHLEGWPGFKSGALNYALAATPPEVEVIGVVDADYLVAPEYLRDLVGYFDDETVAFVQTPQDYRDYGPQSTFYQRACYHAYRYFFDISMPSRSERNAIIFGGTMGLIRADALRTIGGWDEWCITEDAEASLRLLMRGYAGRFVNQSYGRGLMPLEFAALKRQRFRWCFGGIQILRKHWPALLPWARRARPSAGWEAAGLTAAQRYHYLVGGLQWFGDVLTFGFTAIILVTGWLLLLGHPLRLPALGGLLVLLPLTFWATSLLRTIWGLRATRRCTLDEAIGAVAILWSLGWVVTLACLQGLVRRQGVFLRTPKAGRTNLVRAIRSTTIESTLAAACWSLAGLLLAGESARLVHAVSTLIQQGPSRLLALVSSAQWWLLGSSRLALAVLALLQGLVYATAPLLCLLSLRSEKTALEVRRRALGADSGEGTAERRLLAGVGVVAAALVLLLVTTAVLPQANTTLNSNQAKALSILLGPANPVAHPTPAGGGAPTQAPGGAPTTPAGSTPSPTGSATATPTATPRPGGTPTSGGTPTPHGTPSGSPTPHPTPTPRPRP